MRVETERMFDLDPWSKFEQDRVPSDNLHDSIYLIPDRESNLSGRNIVQLPSSDDLITERLFPEYQSGIASRTDTRVEVRGGVSWGGKDGVKGDLSVKGSVRDKDNNRDLEMEYKRDSDGENRVEVSGGAGKEGTERDTVDHSSQYDHR